MPQPVFNKKPVAIWPEQDGKGIKVTIQKTYKDKSDGSWKKTSNYFPNELPLVIEAITAAIEWFRQNRPELLERRKKSMDVQEPEVVSNEPRPSKGFNENVY